MYETHSHTPLCKHAAGKPEEYAAVAIERGLTGLTVTCHNPMPDGFGTRYRMAPEQFNEYLELVERARREIPVVVGADAHEPNRVGALFPEALDLLEQCGYKTISHLSTAKGSRRQSLGRGRL